MEAWSSLAYDNGLENRRRRKCPWVQILPLPPYGSLLNDGKEDGLLNR